MVNSFVVDSATRSNFDELLVALDDFQLNDDELLLKHLRSLPANDLKYLRVILFAAHGIHKKIEIAKKYTDNKPGAIIPLPVMLWSKVTPKPPTRAVRVCVLRRLRFSIQQADA